MKESISAKLKISIIIVWLFTVSGVVGILSSQSDWFLSMTPLNLLMYLTIILINIKTYNKRVIIALIIPLVLGFVTEALGVNYGLIYGSYAYGNNLGPKIIGVPFLICINWMVLTVVTADVARFFSKHLIVSAILGALMMTSLDFIIEISAPRFDFWEFEDGIVPFQNYIGWFVTSLVAHLAYQKLRVESNPILSWHVLVSIILFFSVFVFL